MQSLAIQAHFYMPGIGWAAGSFIDDDNNILT